MKQSEKNFAYEIVSLKDSRDLMKRISKFLIETKSLDFGANGVIRVSIEYENFYER